MMTRIEIYDMVAVATNLSALGLAAGEVGAVVEVYGEGEAYEVEFCDDSGVTYGLHTLRAGQLVALTPEERHPVSESGPPSSSSSSG